MSFVCSERRPANDGTGIKGMFYNIFSVVYVWYARIHCHYLFFVLIIVTLQERSLRCQ